MGFSFRFVGGQFDGGEFPLKPNREITIGRGSEYDMVLEEDMVSRQHARVSTYNGDIIIVDLDSTNGTLVNGTAISEQQLNIGDEVTIGTVTLKVVESKTIGGTGSLPRTNEELTRGHPERRTIHRTGLEGRFPGDGIDISALLRRLLASGKPASLALKDTLGVRVKIYMSDGELCWAKMRTAAGEEGADAPRKALFRGLAMKEGTYRVRGFDRDKSFPGSLNESADDLLVEGEAHRIELEAYVDSMPSVKEKIEIVHPLEARLSTLPAACLDTFQLVMNEGVVQRVLDESTTTDLETCQDLVYLLENDYILVVH
jgi:pSer/pThr/pTyr-binding forkhead associated (FHA) protein